MNKWNRRLFSQNPFRTEIHFYWLFFSTLTEKWTPNDRSGIVRYVTEVNRFQLLDAAMREKTLGKGNNEQFIQRIRIIVTLIVRDNCTFILGSFNFFHYILIANTMPIILKNIFEIFRCFIVSAVSVELFKFLLNNHSLLRCNYLIWGRRCSQVKIIALLFRTVI